MFKSEHKRFGILCTLNIQLSVDWMCISKKVDILTSQSKRKKTILRYLWYRCSMSNQIFQIWLDFPDTLLWFLFITICLINLEYILTLLIIMCMHLSIKIKRNWSCTKSTSSTITQSVGLKLQVCSCSTDFQEDPRAETSVSKWNACRAAVWDIFYLFPQC